LLRLLSYLDQGHLIKAKLISSPPRGRSRKSAFDAAGKASSYFQFSLNCPQITAAELYNQLEIYSLNWLNEFLMHKVNLYFRKRDDFCVLKNKEAKN
jgi:hypothetical protein